MGSRLLRDRSALDAPEEGVTRRDQIHLKSAMASRDGLAILEKYEHEGLVMKELLRSFHGWS
jgi:hypothetical protein